MTVDWQSVAASNNADWCDAVARSHGLTTERQRGVWFCRQRMPPLYPNVVTLEATALSGALVADLVAVLPQGFGVKDSFRCLDLRQSGFSVLFDAQWYCRPPGVARGARLAERVLVKRVGSESELTRWVAAWGATPTGAQVFRLAILDNPEVSLLFVEQRARIVAGLATNRSGRVVGISNAFGEPREVQRCIDTLAASDERPAIVGYGSGEELAALAPLGFAAAGDLRVWTRT